MKFKFIIVILLFVGILCMTVSLTKSSTQCPESKITYRYIPRTFEEEQTEPVFVSEIFEKMQLGTKTQAYVNKIRPDGKVDLILKNASTDSIDEIAVQILQTLADNNGSIKLNDKSSSEDIAKQFKVSRKKFKVALAGLYSKRLIKITPNGTELVKKT